MSANKSATTRIRIAPDGTAVRILPDGSKTPFTIPEPDRVRLDAMTDEEITKAALSDPDNPPLSDEQLARMERMPDLKHLRRRLGMTQEQFARTYHLPLGTVREWEQHRRFPDTPARVLLRAIERDPEAMRRLLAPEAA